MPELRFPNFRICDFGPQEYSEDLNDREQGVRFDDFLCMDAFRMGIKSKDDLRRYSLEELEKMCPKDKRLFVRLKKLKAIYG